MLSGSVLGRSPRLSSLPWEPATGLSFPGKSLVSEVPRPPGSFSIGENCIGKNIWAMKEWDNTRKMTTYSHTESSWWLLDRISSGSLIPKTRAQLGQQPLLQADSPSTASEGPHLRGTPAMEQPLGRTSRLAALWSWCWGGGAEPERKKEEEMEALVVQRQSHAQALPRLEKTGTSISIQATTQAGILTRVWGPKEGKEKYLQRWRVAPLPLPTILSCFPHPASPSWAQGTAHSASTLQQPPH